MTFDFNSIHTIRKTVKVVAKERKISTRTTLRNITINGDCNDEASEIRTLSSAEAVRGRSEVQAMPSSFSPSSPSPSCLTLVKLFPFLTRVLMSVTKRLRVLFNPIF